MPFKPVDQAIKVILGPCIDDTDFKSREESLTYDQAGMEIDIILEKHDGTVTVTAVTPTTGGDYDWAHTDQGYYELEIPASGGASYNNDTEGILHVVGYCTGVLPFRSPSYDVVPEKVYNSLVEGSDNLEVDQVQLGGSTQSATDLKDFADTGYNPTTHVAQSDMTYIHGTALTETAGQLAARFVDFFDQASAAFNVATALSSFKATGFSTHTAANVRTEMDANSTGFVQILADLASAASEVSEALQDTAELQTDWHDGGRLDLLIDAILLDTGTTLENHLTDIKGTGFVKDTHSLPQCLTATGFSTLSQAQVNAEVVDVVNVDALVAGQSMAEALRRIGALTSGIVSGAGTGTETFKDYAESVNTIVVTVDASGNRSAIVYN